MFFTVKGILICCPGTRRSHLNSIFRTFLENIFISDIKWNLTIHILNKPVPIQSCISTNKAPDLDLLQFAGTNSKQWYDKALFIVHMTLLGVCCR